MEDLKSCPFCGGLAEVYEDEYWYWEWKVECKNDIRHHLEYFSTKEEAIEAWNRRVRDAEV